MATIFIEPGGDATFNLATIPNNGFWTTITGGVNAPILATDFVHGTHVNSIQYLQSGTGSYLQKAAMLADAGSRISCYFYFNGLGNTTTIIMAQDAAVANNIFFLKITNTGVLQLFGTAQIGSNGATLTTGKWYRICVTYTITSATVNRFEVFLDGASTISVTNGTLDAAGSSRFLFGNISGDTVIDFRASDLYIDNSSSLTDPGDVWVTAKRPFANGTTNGFTTQIGAGGSGYGSGHAPQENERPINQTNGWRIAAASAITEEYNIEAKNVGDINLANATIVDYLGWVSASALISETGNIIVNGGSSNISLTSAPTIFLKAAGSTTYPTGTGTDIGIITSATVTTVSLYECGVMVAFIPGSASNPSHFLSLLGIGS